MPSPARIIEIRNAEQEIAALRAQLDHLQSTVHRPALLSDARPALERVVKQWTWIRSRFYALFLNITGVLYKSGMPIPLETGVGAKRMPESGQTQVG